MKYIILTVCFGLLVLIGIEIYFDIQHAQQKPAIEVVNTHVAEPIQEPKIEPKVMVTPKKTIIVDKKVKTSPKPEITQITTPTVEIKETTKPIENVKSVAEDTKIESVPEKKPDYITKWELESYYSYSNGYTDVSVKGYPIWSNGIGTAYLTGCDLIWRVYTPSNILSFEETFKMQQVDGYNFKVQTPYNIEKASPVVVCKTFSFDKQGNEITHKSPEIKIK